MCTNTAASNKGNFWGDVFFPGTNTSFQTHAWFLGNKIHERSCRLRKISLNMFFLKTPFVAN